MQENKRNLGFPLEEVVQNDSLNNGPVKEYFHYLVDQITREAAVAHIIFDNLFLLNNLFMMIVSIVDQLLEEL